MIILILVFHMFIEIVDSTRHLSFRTSKDIQRKEMADSSMTDEKQILISYVRAEAAHHAIALKQELSSLGYSVYLVRHSCLIFKWWLFLWQLIDFFINLKAICHHPKYIIVLLLISFKIHSQMLRFFLFLFVCCFFRGEDALGSDNAGTCCQVHISGHYDKF